MSHVTNPVFLHGKDSELMVNEHDLTCYVNNIDLTQDIDLPEVTTFCDDTRRYINGLRNATGSIGGFIDNDALNGIDAILQATFNVPTSSIWSDAPNGFGVGNIAYLFRALISSYNTTQPVDGVQAFTADLQLDGNLTRGASLHALAAETATGMGTSVDNGVATNNGGIAHLHVHLVESGSTTLDVTVEDSPDDMTFTLVPGLTFTQVTTLPTSERVETALGLTIDPFVRASWTVGLTSSYTFVVTFGRRP